METLIRILEHVIDPSEWTLEHLRTLALVSRDWKSVVASAPSLWSVLRYGELDSQNLGHVRLAATKSKASPLVVILEGSQATSSEGVHGFMTLAVRHSTRWRTARFCSQHLGIVKSCLIKASTPLLGSLPIEQQVSNGEEGWEWEWHMHAVEGPSMHDLSLQGVFLLGDWAKLSALKQLSLHSILAPHGVTLVQMLAMLASFPSWKACLSPLWTFPTNLLQTRLLFRLSYSHTFTPSR